jgi:hypothetical protein
MEKEPFCAQYEPKEGWLFFRHKMFYFRRKIKVCFIKFWLFFRLGGNGEADVDALPV